jgi:hypothetical protein
MTTLTTLKSKTDTRPKKPLSEVEYGGTAYYSERTKDNPEAKTAQAWDDLSSGQQHSWLMAQRIQREILEKRYHPDLHPAIRELTKYHKITFWGPEEASYVMENVMDEFGSFPKEQVDRFKEALHAFCVRQRPNLDQVCEQYKKVKKEMAELSQGAQRVSSQAWRHSYQQRQTWKDVAKDLGIHKYLTDNGALSRAKITKKHSEDQAKITEIFDIYNKQYVPKANELMKKNSENKPKVNEQDEQQRQRYNELVPEVNRLQREILLLSGNLLDPRSLL